MGAQIITTTKLHLIVLLIIMCQLVLTHGKSQTWAINNSCESSSSSSSSKSFHCNITNTTNTHCHTFAILRTKSKSKSNYFSSLSALSFFLGVDRSSLAKVNGFSAKTDSLPKHRSLLVPIVCDCDHGSGLFLSRLSINIAVKKGPPESFSSSIIFEALQGLVTCEAIKDQNPKNSTSFEIRVPCGCLEPGSDSLLLSYPVARAGDTISNLASKFRTSEEAIISANSIFPSEILKPFTTILIPVNTTFPLVGEKPKMGQIGPFIAVIIAVSIGISITIAAAFFIVQIRNRKNSNVMKMKKLNNGNVDSEIQRLGLSVRTTSDKKVSFDGSNTHETIDATGVTPRNPTAAAERFTANEMSRATGDFGSGNHIEGSVYHGRLNGKDLAIKRVTQETFSNLDSGLFSLSSKNHPNIMRLIGTCEEEIESSFFVVFEYAKNGSLRDWLHGGLAIKSHFIASCYCFLTWTQRLNICLDVAMALQYMHYAIEPRHVHGGIKSKNIFLDEDFSAKVSNFGLGKKTDALESPSADVFDYGVLLLEVLSGQMEIPRPNETVKGVLGSESVVEGMREWMDSALGEKFRHEEAVELANLARLCTEEDEALRPNAEEIVESLARLVGGESARGGFGECSLVISESSSKPLVVKEV